MNVRDLLSVRAMRQPTRLIPAVIVVLFILVLLASTLPRSEPRIPFVETSRWSLVVVVAFAGWGSLLAQVIGRRERVDLGLRIAWGAAVMGFIGGLLIVPSVMTRNVGMILVELGAVLAVLAALREHEAVRDAFRFVIRLARREPRLAFVALVVMGLFAIHYLGGVAEWHTDPYDDDIAYLTFVKKLLDTGSFPEPFSFRRLSALGSQTFFISLVALRAAPNQAHTFDRAICLLLIALLIIGHRSRGRRPSFVFMVALVLLVPLLPIVTRNTASHYSAIAFFVALFRTVVWAGERDVIGASGVNDPSNALAAWRTALPIAFVSAIVCTLRQNYLPLPPLFLGVSYLARAWESRRNGTTSLKERLSSWLAEPALVAVFTLVALVPWFIAAWQSNQTFLYPLMTGTYNKALQLRSDTVTFVHEVRLALSTMLEGMPLYTIGLFFLAGMLARAPSGRRGARQPLLAFLLASFAGYVLLIHALSLGDPGNLGRYAVGFIVAAAIAIALTTGLARYRSSNRRAQVAAGFALLALLLQLGRSSESATKFYGRALRNIDEALVQQPRGYVTERVEEEIYAKLQLTVPAGQRIAVLLDEPHWFDFKRNPIWNLDMPGYSSLPPGMPFFRGSQKVEEYFKGLGIRYLAFVRSDVSRYHYRREYWLYLLADEMDIWRTFAPYVIDFTDNLLDIATRHRHLWEKNGMILLDLEAPP